MNERQRIQKIIDSEGMTAKQFSTELGISAGTISNIMKGRNNPSLEVMQAVLERFRTINSDWLILGVGPMYRPTGEGIQTTLFDVKPQETASDNTPTEAKENPTTLMAATPAINKTVTKITVFYSDGTFEDR